MLSRGTGKEEQKKLDKVIIRGKEREGMDLLLLRPYDTRPTNTNHHLGSSSSSKGGKPSIVVQGNWVSHKAALVSVRSTDWRGVALTSHAKMNTKT